MCVVWRVWLEVVIWGLMLGGSFCFGGVGVGAASGGARGAVEAGGGDHGDDHGGVER